MKTNRKPTLAEDILDLAQLATVCAVVSFGLTLGAGLAWAVLRVVWGWM